MAPTSGDQADNPLLLVSDALRRRDPRSAGEIASRTLAAGFSHPLLHTARAMALSEEGRHDEALKEFRCAEAMGPANPSLKSSVALCLTRLGRPNEAIAEYDAAIALAPDNAQLHCRKGWACELSNDLDAARQAHEKAVALDPGFPEALARLALLAARRASFEEARGFAERALAKDPQHPCALLAMAMAALDRGAYGEAESCLKTVLANQRAGSTEKHLAAGLMGDACDRQDRCDEAFAFYSEANETALKQLRRPSGAPPTIETVQWLRRHFESMPPRAQFQGDGAGSRQIFVLGFLRAGTTLIQEVLAARDDTVVLDEKDALADAADAFMADAKGLDRLWAADGKTLAHFRERYWARVQSFGIVPDGKVLIDKMPFATMRIPLIMRLFPEATIVFAVRDPRDVAWSCFRQRFAMNATTQELLTLESAARLYSETMRLADLYREKLSPKLFDLRLEDLIDDFDGRTRALCAFAGLEWQAGMRGFASRSGRRAITTPSSVQVVRGLNREGIGQWRRYANRLEPVMGVLGPWVERFGYSSDDVSPRHHAP